MDKGKQIMVENEDDQKRPRKRQLMMDEGDQPREVIDHEYEEAKEIHKAHEIHKLHNHYKAIMVMLEKQIRAKEDAFESRVKYERKNAKVRLLLKQISAEDFDIGAELNRLSAREEKLYKEWAKIEIPDVGFDKMGCNLKGFGGPSWG